MTVRDWMQQAHKNAGWLVALGVLEIILGIAVMVLPLAGGLAITVILGVALIFGGVARLIAAFRADGFGAGVLAFIWGLLVAAGGAYILANPAIALASLTLVLAVVFVMSGIAQILVSFKIKPISGWGWVLTSGIVSLVLGIMAWKQFPYSGLWFVGVLLGVHLLMAGLATLAIGRTARRLTSIA